MSTASTPSIDVHAHLFPQSAVSAAREGTEWFGLPVWNDNDGRPVAQTEMGPITFGSRRHLEPPETRVRRMDDIGVDKQLLSVLPPLYQYGRGERGKAESLRAVNEEIAGMIDAWPDRFGGLAALPLPDVGASVKEMQRIADLGFDGIAVGSQVDGANWNEKHLLPVLESAEELGLLVFIHPILPRCGSAAGEFYLHNLIGNPYETTVAAASLVFSGLLDRCPDLRVCLAHAGGYTTFAIGRFAHGYEVRRELGGLQRAPEDYLDRFLYDTITHDGGALRYVVGRVGVERVVLGTDYPSDMGLDDPVRWLEQQDWLGDRERRLILGGNLADVLGGGRQ